MADEAKIPLPKFLKILSSNGVPVSKAMIIAGKIYKDCNTPSGLVELTDVKLSSMGVSNKEDRGIVLAAIRKGGYVYKGKSLTKKEAIEKKVSPVAGPSESVETKIGTSTAQTTVSPKKRKRRTDKNEYLPDETPDEGMHDGSFEFDEILDEDALRNKSVIINRAPVMTAWAMVVSERLGFKREEALSIASVYTEMNAISKGMSLGVFDEGKGKGMEAASTGTQPYVDLMGRSPLYQTQEGQWRALSKGSPVFPGSAFSYICRSFRQTTPHIIGALRCLAKCYSPNVLNNKGWALYAEFRPQVDGWGKHSEVRCETILNLRPKNEHGNPANGVSGQELEFVQPIIDVEQSNSGQPPPDTRRLDEPQTKRARTLTVDEYEAAVEHDTIFDNVNLDFS